MRHLAIILAGGFAAALVSTQSQAASSDPSGVWLKDDGSAKIEVSKCGHNQLCSKIVWLKDPNDSRGKPLHDARNEDPSKRNRPILGMSLFISMNQVEPGVWQGSVYNPEEGHIYDDVKITLASSRQIVLHGCKAWLLCGEKVWTRTQFEKPATEEIEANASGKPSDVKPSEAKAEAVADKDGHGKLDVKASAKTAVAAATPKPAMVEADAGASPSLAAAFSKPKPSAPQAPALNPPLPQASQDQRDSYGFTTTSAIPNPAPIFSSDRPSTMFAVTAPLDEPQAEPSAVPAGDETATAERDDSDHDVGNAPVPLPDQKPKAKPKPRVSAALEADASGSTPVPAALRAKPKPLAKKAPEEDLPWLQHP